MRDWFEKQATLPLVTAILGCIVGYFLADFAAKDRISKLQAEIGQLRAGLERASRQVLATQTPAANSAASIGVEKTVEVQQPLSGSEIKAERHRRRNEGFVGKMAARNTDEYSGVFSELGLGLEAAERFKSNRVELHTKAIAAGEPLQELKIARYKYDKEIRAALGEENYARYRSYEESKPAAREYDKLLEYSVKSRNIAIDPAYSERIIELVKNAGATTTETWDGPYDPLPHPEVGDQAVDRLSQQIADIKERSKALVQTAREGELPEEYTRLIADYYANTLQNLEEKLKFSALSFEEQKQVMEKRMEQDQRERDQRK